MCAGCFIHLLADARLKEEQATCPNCRCEISKSLCCRNLAVEKAVSELPSECAQTQVPSGPGHSSFQCTALYGLAQGTWLLFTSASLGRLLSSPWEGLFTVFTGQNTTEYFVLNLMLSL